MRITPVIPAPRPSLLRRLAVATVAVVLAAAIAAGCGSSDGGDSGGSGDSGVIGNDGPLAWLPQDTWLVTTANLDDEQIDEAVTTLGRLPIWALAEGFLPARDGEGLRKELLEQIAKEASSEKGATKVTATDLEAAFGDRLGLALTSTDFEAIDDGDDAPVMIWIEVDDEDRATEVVADMYPGDEDERDHEGQGYFASKDDEATWLVRDGLLILSTTPERMEALIDVREGDADDSLAGDDTAAAVLEAGIGDSFMGIAVATDPLLDAGPEIARASASSDIARGARMEVAPVTPPEDRGGPQDGDPKSVPDEGEEEAEENAAEAESEEQADEAEAIAKQLEPVLQSEAIDGMVPDWLGGSITIDTTGLRMRGVWSNPRELASPEPGSRELVERMPVEAPIVQASAMSGTELGRVQDAWAEVRDAYDLDLRELVAAECAVADRWACTLGAELAVAVLEDEALADAQREAGDTVTAYSQDIAPLLAMAASASTNPNEVPKAPTSPLMELVTSSSLEGYEAPEELVAAAAAAGITWKANADGTSVNVKVKPGSPAAREIATAASRPQDIAALAAFGLDVRSLLSPQGLTLTAERVDDLLVATIPPETPSKAVPALEGDADTIADSQTYTEVVEAAKPPKDVGAYGYVDLKAYFEGFLTALGDADPQIQRALPTVRNNLADVPGILQWSTREEVDGEQVGVYEAVIPILE